MAILSEWHQADIYRYCADRRNMMYRSIIPDTLEHSEWRCPPEFTPQSPGVIGNIIRSDHALIEGKSSNS